MGNLWPLPSLYLLPFRWSTSSNNNAQQLKPVNLLCFNKGASAPLYICFSLEEKYEFRRFPRTTEKKTLRMSIKKWALVFFTFGRKKRRQHEALSITRNKCLLLFQRGNPPFQGNSWKLHFSRRRECRWWRQADKFCLKRSDFSLWFENDEILTTFDQVRGEEAAQIRIRQLFR